MQKESPDQRWSGVCVSKILFERIILRILQLPLLQNPLMKIMFYNN